jgi:hypothetical protein
MICTANTFSMMKFEGINEWRVGEGAHWQQKVGEVAA